MNIPETIKQDFRVSPDEKEEYQTISDFIVRSGERGQRGATKAVMFGWICSRDPELLRRLSKRLSEYADMLERTGTGKRSEVLARSEMEPSSIQLATCSGAMI